MNKHNLKLINFKMIKKKYNIKLIRIKMIKKKITTNKVLELNKIILQVNNKTIKNLIILKFRKILFLNIYQAIAIMIENHRIDRILLYH